MKNWNEYVQESQEKLGYSLADWKPVYRICVVEESASIEQDVWDSLLDKMVE